jgi:exosome complex RNA-binding protein Rrp42 (RNase PH superfamily)
MFLVSQEDFRYDGRTRLDYRPMEVETDVVSHASGSARLRLANTDILVGVKAEIDTPYPERPREGKIEFFVDWYVRLCSFFTRYVLRILVDYGSETSCPI